MSSFKTNHLKQVEQGIVFIHYLKGENKMTEKTPLAAVKKFYEDNVKITEIWNTYEEDEFKEGDYTYLLVDQPEEVHLVTVLKLSDDTYKLEKEQTRKYLKADMFESMVGLVKTIKNGLNTSEKK